MNIKKFSLGLLVVFSIVLSGCVATTANNKNGTITTIDITSISEILSKDVVTFLGKQFSPANTKFNISQQVLSNDKFGKSLIEQLRQRGFEIQENSVSNPYNNMSFIVDNSQSLGFVRVLINIDNSTYSRCYSSTGSALSSWSVIKK